MSTSSIRPAFDRVEVGQLPEHLNGEFSDDTTILIGECGQVSLAGGRDSHRASISLRGDGASFRVTIGRSRIDSRGELRLVVEFVPGIGDAEVRVARPADATSRSDTPSADQREFLRFMPCDANGDPALLLGGNLAEHEGLFAGLADAAWAGGGDDDAASGIQPTHVARVEVRVLDVWPVATVAASEVPAP